MRTAPIETAYSPLTTSTPPQERGHTATPAHADVRRERLLSLDVFRGAHPRGLASPCALVPAAAWMS